MRCFFFKGNKSNKTETRIRSVNGRMYVSNANTNPSLPQKVSGIVLVLIVILQVCAGKTKLVIFYMPYSLYNIAKRWEIDIYFMFKTFR